ncbi:MAG: pspB [Alphaproteobacteria bacterium]|nr:pspB [Alphaproteobacteria bacterium]
MHLPETVAALSLFLGLPWLIFHYITRWKTAATLTTGDERTIEALYDLARRLDDRVRTVERIVTADNPNWREIASDAPERAVEDRNETSRRIK